MTLLIRLMTAGIKRPLELKNIWVEAADCRERSLTAFFHIHLIDCKMHGVSTFYMNRSRRIELNLKGFFL